MSRKLIGGIKCIVRPVFDSLVMNRTFWIDLIRVAGAFLIVMSHVCNRVSGGFSVSVEKSGEVHGSLGWMASLCFHTLSCVAVPLFLMVSGALLLGRSEEMLTFYRKRFGKVLLPFFAWSCVFILCLWIAGRGLRDGTEITLLSSIGALLSGNVSGHFWFMYMLIVLYLVTPFLAVFTRNATKSMLIGFLILWFFAVVIFPVINNVARETLDITSIAGYSPFERGFVSYSVGFFIAGYVLKEIVISKRWAIIAVIAWIVLAMSPVNAYLRMAYPDSSMSFLFVFMGTYVLPIIAHPATLSLIAFLALRSLGDLPSVSSSRFGRIVLAFAPLTFGIFLCHHLFLVPSMEILDQYLGLSTTESWLLVLCAVPTLTVVFYLIAAGVVYLIRQNQYLKSLLAP